jgi:transcriptional regulator with XRE-family HTH domain
VGGCRSKEQTYSDRNGDVTEEGQNPHSEVLGAYIRAQRRLADLSLRQLAELSDVSNAYLSQVERGLHQPSLKVVQSIAHALNLSSEVLLAEAGLLEKHSKAGPTDTEAAISADLELSHEDKQVLLGVYRSLRQRRNTEPTVTND